MSQEDYMQITDLLGKYRAALLLLLPIFDEVGIGWREGEAADPLLRIHDALYESIVCDALADRVCAPPGIGYRVDPEQDSILYDRDLGPDFSFYELKHGAEPYGTACFIRRDNDTDPGHEEREKPFSACHFLLLPRKYSGEYGDAVSVVDVDPYPSTP